MRATYYELQGARALARKETDLDERDLGDSAILAKTEYSVISTGTELAAWTALRRFGRRRSIRG